MSQQYRNRPQNSRRGNSYGGRDSKKSESNDLSTYRPWNLKSLKIETPVETNENLNNQESEPNRSDYGRHSRETPRRRYTSGDINNIDNQWKQSSHSRRSNGEGRYERSEDDDFRRSWTRRSSSPMENKRSSFPEHDNDLYWNDKPNNNDEGTQLWDSPISDQKENSPRWSPEKRRSNEKRGREKKAFERRDSWGKGDGESSWWDTTQKVTADTWRNLEGDDNKEHSWGNDGYSRENEQNSWGNEKNSWRNAEEPSWVNAKNQDNGVEDSWGSHEKKGNETEHTWGDKKQDNEMENTWGDKKQDNNVEYTWGDKKQDNKTENSWGNPGKQDNGAKHTWGNKKQDNEVGSSWENSGVKGNERNRAWGNKKQGNKVGSSWENKKQDNQAESSWENHGEKGNEVSTWENKRQDNQVESSWGNPGEEVNTWENKKQDNEVENSWGNPGGKDNEVKLTWENKKQDSEVENSWKNPGGKDNEVKLTWEDKKQDKVESLGENSGGKDNEEKHTREDKSENSWEEKHTQEDKKQDKVENSWENPGGKENEAKSTWKSGNQDNEIESLWGNLGGKDNEAKHTWGSKKQDNEAEHLWEKTDSDTVHTTKKDNKVEIEEKENEAEHLWEETDSDAVHTTQKDKVDIEEKENEAKRSQEDTAQKDNEMVHTSRSTEENVNEAEHLWENAPQNGNEPEHTWENMKENENRAENFGKNTENYDNETERSIEKESPTPEKKFDQSEASRETQEEERGNALAPELGASQTAAKSENSQIIEEIVTYSASSEDLHTSDHSLEENPAFSADNNPIPDVTLSDEPSKSHEWKAEKIDSSAQENITNGNEETIVASVEEGSYTSETSNDSEDLSPIKLTGDIDTPKSQPSSQGLDEIDHHSILSPETSKSSTPAAQEVTTSSPDGEFDTEDTPKDGSSNNTESKIDTDSCIDGDSVITCGAINISRRRWSNRFILGQLLDTLLVD